MASDFEEGLLVGLLVGEGHFGGDGRQPQVTLRMHERHASLFRWLERTYPGGRLYGPYDHGGRRYYQWMVRGAYLRDVLLPLVRARLTTEIDKYAYDRLDRMCVDYSRQLGTAEVGAPGRSSTSHAQPVEPARPTAGTPSARVAEVFAALRHGRRDGDGTAGLGQPQR